MRDIMSGDNFSSIFFVSFDVARVLWVKTLRDADVHRIESIEESKILTPPFLPPRDQQLQTHCLKIVHGCQVFQVKFSGLLASIWLVIYHHLPSLLQSAATSCTEISSSQHHSRNVCNCREGKHNSSHQPTEFAHWRRTPQYRLSTAGGAV